MPGLLFIQARITLCKYTVWMYDTNVYNFFCYLSVWLLVAVVKAIANLTVSKLEVGDAWGLTFLVHVVY